MGLAVCRQALRWVWPIALAPVALHLWIDPHYHFFRDELYYLSCAARPALGYVDHPPLSIWLLGVWTAVFGDSLHAVRAIPAVGHGLYTILGGALAVALGGGRWATRVAALATMLSPIAFVFFDLFSMNSLEMLLWCWVSLLVVLLVRTDSRRYWWSIGVAMGLALLNKHTSAVLGVGLGAGILVSPLRSHLLRKEPWGAVAIAFVILLPNLIWQHQADWASLEFYRNAQAEKNIALDPISVLVGQIFAQGPASCPLWLTGLVALLIAGGPFRRLMAPDGESGAAFDSRRLRILGIAFCFLFAVMIVSRSSRPDRIAGLYPVLFAAGAVALDRLFALLQRRLLHAYAVFIALGGLALLPIASSSLPPRYAQGYMASLSGILQIERGRSAPLPQWLADRTGWRDLSDQIEAIYLSLPPHERTTAGIYAENYGQAGAIEYYGRRWDAPLVLCNHNSFHGWAAAGLSADPLIAIDADPEDLRQLYDNVAEVAVTTCDLCMEHERDEPIYVARGLRGETLREFWSQIARYD